jgi:hypothetical protein
MRYKFSKVLDPEDVKRVRANISRVRGLMADQLVAREDLAQETRILVEDLRRKYEAPHTLHIVVDASHVEDHDVAFLQSQETFDPGEEEDAGGMLGGRVLN